MLQPHNAPLLRTQSLAYTEASASNTFSRREPHRQHIDAPGQKRKSVDVGIHWVGSVVDLEK